MNTRNKPRTGSLSDEVRRVSQNTEQSAQGFLAKIFLKLLEMTLSVPLKNIEQDRSILEGWNNLVNKYLSDPRNAIIQSRDKLNSERGNLKKELIRGSMTWKTLVGKGFRLVQCIKVDFHLRFYMKDGRRFTYSDTLVVDPESMPDHEYSEAAGQSPQSKHNPYDHL